jgi:hypothetical protein
MSHSKEVDMTDRFAQRWLLLLAMVCCCAGCQQKMAGQPSYRPLQPCELFSDGRASRPLIAGTVARGHLRTNLALYSGRKSRQAETDQVNNESSNDPDAARKHKDENKNFVDEFPLAVDLQLIEHGRNRFEIYCVVCHDSLGTGHGKIVERGYTRPPSYHIQRLREAPVGRLFAVISDGYGSMPSYGGQIPPEDRWAIVAYLRALQLSQHFPADEVPDDWRQTGESESPDQP